MLHQTKVLWCRPGRDPHGLENRGKPTGQDRKVLALLTMAKKLTDLEIVEASGVDHPAHLHEGWLLMKSLDEILEEADTLASDDDSHDDTGGTAVSEESNAEQAEATDEAIEDTEPVTVDASDAEEAVDDREPVMASVDDDRETLAKQIDDLRKRATDAETLAKALQHERAVEKATERVHGWSYLPQMTDEFTKTLVSLRHDSPTEATAVEKVLDAANALLSENITMAQIGSDGEPGNQTAWEQIDALAKAAVSDGKFSLYTDALQSVTIANPGLYEEHRSETQMGRN